MPPSPHPAPDGTGATARAGAAPVALRAAGRCYGAFRALQPLELEIRAGERVALVGPSGAGKTTALRLLATTLAPSEGRVEVLGEDPARLGARALRRLRARVGTIHQELHLVPQSTTFQNVVAGRLGRTTLAGALALLVSRREVTEVRELLAALGIADKLFERVDLLSGGERQRVAIARTLHQDPELVLADEPLSSVDPERASDVAALLSRAFAGRTLVVSTHHIDPLLPHVDRVVGLRAGELAFDVPSSRLRPNDLAALYRGERCDGAAGTGAAVRERPGGKP